jgi:hypothetical protein
MQQHREIVTLPVAVTRSRVARGRVMTICRSHLMIWKNWKMMTGRCVCVRMDGEGKERGMQLTLVSLVQEHGSNWALLCSSCGDTNLCRDDVIQQPS